LLRSVTCCAIRSAGRLASVALSVNSHGRYIVRTEAASPAGRPVNDGTGDVKYGLGGQR
jgi:hypothetical protein